MISTWQQLLKQRGPAVDRPLLVDGSEGSSTAFLLWHYKEAVCLEAPLLVLVANEKRLQELYDDLCCFVENHKLLILPPRKVRAGTSLLQTEDHSADRVAALFHLQQGFDGIVLTTLSALRQPTLPMAKLQNYCRSFKVGEEFDLENLISHLVTSGYRRESMVHEPGQFAIRGGMVDLFSPQEKAPYRIELFGDFVESIRFFDPAKQRSTKTLQSFTVIPASELVASSEDFLRASNRVKEISDKLNIAKSLRQPFQQFFADELHQPEMLDCLHLFYKEKPAIFDFLRQTCHIAQLNRMAIESEQQNIDEKSEELLVRAKQADNEFIFPDIFIDRQKTSERLTQWPWVIFEDTGHDLPENSTTLAFKFDRLPQSKTFMTDRIRGFVQQGYETHIVCYNEAQKEKIVRIFANDPQEKLQFSVGQLSSSVLSQDEKVLYLPDREIFGLKTKRRIPSSPADATIDQRELDKFKEGSYIVHLDHGIGRYIGMQHLKVDGDESDFLLLEYKGGDKLYLPVYRLNIIQNYAVGDNDEDDGVQLDRLGGTSWSTRKQKVKQAIEVMAKELLKLYASRKVVEGFSFQGRDDNFAEFEAAFPYTETRDQARAIDDVLHDMETPRPMDRLVCGDVGFGKTEVAMRGAFRAVLDGKQVAILVPTTLLAEQHYQTFTERFEPFGAKVDRLSRFKSTAEIRETIEKMKKGEVDIIVGTHRLLSKDVAFKDLGLLVIDEEHRFGVTHKDKIKQYRSKVDVIAMTATPIPRTLQMSLHGFRDLSIIETPPADRQAIATYIARFDDALIRGAVLKELERNGQVFFVHNRVQTIDAMAKYLTKLVPEAVVGIVHGEMGERQVEKTMLDFLQGRVKILLATTIIESGLDFSNANTILINRADRFGLAQLYQLRGRVGRSNENAFCYLMIPGDDLISEQAQKRLRALRAFTELGSGYRIALRDLEIRGAGNLLGTRQSGHIRSIGMDLYTSLLEKSVRELQGEVVEKDFEPELLLGQAAFLPKEFIEDERLRLNLYRRISDCNNGKEISAMREELTDRFGKLPLPLLNLLNIVELRSAAKRARVSKIKSGPNGLALTFDASTPIKPEKLLQFLSQPENNAKMLDAHSLFVSTTQNDKRIGLEQIKKLLQQLS